LRSTANFGLPPIRFITQRGPFQDGETPLDIRLDPRVIQVEVANYLCNRTEFWTTRNELLDLIRPNRAFAADGTYRPLIYRKRLPGGKSERGSDGVTNGTNTLTSAYGRFVHYGGLQPGDPIVIGGAARTVASVLNDYTLVFTGGAIGAATNVAWRYPRNHALRDLAVLLEQGPTFDEQIGPYRHPESYREALRFVAHDPLWYGAMQSETWAIDAALGDLVFDGAGAWFGASPGVGRWLFSTSYVGETVGIVYWGTWPARPVVVIRGPADNPLIVNSTTGTQLALGYSIALGETVTLDTQNLTVTNNAGVNLLAYLTGDLATFALEPEPQAPQRLNNVAVSFSGGVLGNSAAILYWQNRYIGI